MAQQPITIVWASTTSNTITITPSDQGNGIVYESDIVSNFLNGALQISSQAIRNLQVMGGYYNAGQDYKQYQFCSQLCYIDSAYQLNFYMATQDSPSLAPTNATSNQTGTTDMVLPISPTSTQSGWQQINLVPNQANIAYTNKPNTFTLHQFFNSSVTLGDNLSDNIAVNGSAVFYNNARFDGNVVLGNTGSDSVQVLGTPTFSVSATFQNGLSITGGNISASGRTSTFGTTTVSSLACSGTSTFSNTATFNGNVAMNGNTTIGNTSSDTLTVNSATTFGYNVTIGGVLRTNSAVQLYGGATTIGDSSSDILAVNSAAYFTNTGYTYFAPSASTTQSVPFGYFFRNSSLAQFMSRGGSTSNSQLAITAASSSWTPSGGVAGCPYIFWAFSGSNYMNFISQTGIKFNTAVTIQNASFGTATFALDPEWEQDYATANYVNQKLQELYDYLDARLATIEEKLGISTTTTLARGITPRDAINEIAVPQSTIKQLFDRIEAMDGYAGVLGYSNAEERKEIAQVKNDESAVMQIVDKIKARKEQEEEEQRQREEQERLELEAQNQNQQ